MDTWVETGTTILPFFDSLLAKLMVHGSSRQDAVARLQKALSGTIIGGISSNLEYLGTIARSEGFAAGHLAHPVSAVLDSCCACAWLTSSKALWQRSCPECIPGLYCQTGAPIQQRSVGSSFLHSASMCRCHHNQIFGSPAVLPQGHRGGSTRHEHHSAGVASHEAAFVLSAMSAAGD